MCVYVWVLHQLTSFLFALLALSHGGDVLKQPRGRHTYSCWQLKRTRGRKWRVLPSFHTPPTSHTDSAANHGECVRVCASVCVCVLMAIWVHVRVCLYYITSSKNICAWLHKLFEISGHICTTCSGAVLRVSGRHYSAWYGKGFDLSGPSHTQRLVQCSPSLPGRWRETQ